MNAKPKLFVPAETLPRNDAPFHQPPRWKRRVAIGALIVAAVAGGWLLLPRGVAVRSSEIETARVERANFAPLLVARGDIVSDSGELVTAFDGGVAQTVHVRNGENVTTGQLLLKLGNLALQRDVVDRLLRLEDQLAELKGVESAVIRDEAESQQRLRDARYRERTAAAELGRYQELEKGDFVSRAQLERVTDAAAHAREDAAAAMAEADLTRAAGARRRAEVERARRRIVELSNLERSRLDALNIRAPVGGVVSGLTLSPGMPVKPQEVVARIAASGDVSVVARLPEGQSASVRPGAAAHLIDAPEVALIVEAVDPVVRAGELSVRLAFRGAAPRNLRTGQSVSVAIQMARPRSALVVRFGDMVGPDRVFVLDKPMRQGRARRVKLGERAGDVVEVRSGLKEGEAVIINSSRVLDGVDRVRIDAEAR